MASQGLVRPFSEWWLHKHNFTAGEAYSAVGLRIGLFCLTEFVFVCLPAFFGSEMTHQDHGQVPAFYEKPVVAT